MEIALPVRGAIHVEWSVKRRCCSRKDFQQHEECEELSISSSTVSTGVFQTAEFFFNEFQIKNVPSLVNKCFKDICFVNPDESNQLNSLNAVHYSVAVAPMCMNAVIMIILISAELFSLNYLFNVCSVLRK